MPELKCSNCGAMMVDRDTSSCCSVCALQEKLFFVFSPSHGVFVRALDEEHAWRVAGEPEDMMPRRIVKQAGFRNGILTFKMPLDRLVARKEGARIEEVLGRDPIPVEVPEDEPQAPVGGFVEGNRTTVPYEAPITKGAVILIGLGASYPLVQDWLEKEPDAEVWTMNDDRHRKTSTHFQIHLKEFFGELGGQSFDYSDLEKRGVRILEPHTYPYHKLRRVWLRSTIDYMLALADAEGYERIYMPGIDFGGSREPKELDSSRYWIGVLEGKGATVFTSPLYNGFDCELYGQNEPDWSKALDLQELRDAGEREGGE